MREAISTQQSERERIVAKSALTLGHGEILLSGKQVIIWSALGETYRDWPKPWLGSVLEELRELLTLPAGWDSYGGVPIDDDEVVKTVITILNVLARAQTPRPRLVPTSAGGIQVEWYTSDIEVQLEAEPGAKLIELYFRDRKTGYSWQGPAGEEPEPLDVLLWRVAMSA